MICSCSLCAAQVEAEDRREGERAEYDRSLKWQFAVVSAARDERGERRLTYSEWLAGCSDDEENPDMEATNRSGHWWLGAVLLILLGLALMLTACATGPTKTETVEVKVPVATHPIAAADVPALPAPLPKRPADARAALDVALAQVCRFVSYAERADPLLRLAAGMPQNEVPLYPECEHK